MAYSIIYANGDGSNKTFSINFPLGFISRDDVTCRVGEEVDGLGDPVYREITWITDGLVTISGDAPPVGTNNVVFYRTVDKEALVHEYTDGVAIEEENLDESNKQLLMALHEFMDNRNQPEQTADLDNNGYKIVNLEDGVLGTDACTVQQAAASILLKPEIDQAASDAQTAANAAQAAAASITIPLPIASGGTASTTAADARTALSVYSIAEVGTQISTCVDSLEALLAPGIQDFRLTLTSGTPVTTSDVTGATTLYCAPYKGNRIALYNGTTWDVISSVGFSKALGTLTPGKPYDVFCYNSAGTPTLEFLVWTNDTTRATSLGWYNGVLVKSGDATRRYLGSFYTTAATTTEDSAVKRLVWNYDNAVPRPVTRYETTSSWVYSTAGYQQANNSAANQIEFLVGVADRQMNISVDANVSNSTSTARSVFVGIGLDTVASMNLLTARSTTSGTGFANIYRNVTFVPSVGRHYVAWVEYGAGADTQTWIGGSIYGLNGSVIS